VCEQNAILKGIDCAKLIWLMSFNFKVKLFMFRCFYFESKFDVKLRVKVINLTQKLLIITSSYIRLESKLFKITFDIDKVDFDGVCIKAYSHQERLTFRVVLSPLDVCIGKHLTWIKDDYHNPRKSFHEIVSSRFPPRGKLHPGLKTQLP
jgi:hypothetical protein